MIKLSAIINRGINAMDCVFTSSELLTWIDKYYHKQFNLCYENYILENKTEKDFYNLIYALIRKSCKVDIISVLEMPDSNNNYMINYVMVKENN